jgi:DNA-binding transcriptional LysR family regulator
MFVAPAIPSFLEKHPELIVSLSFTDDIVDLLAQQADVAIRMGTLPDSSLVARRLGQSRRVVCAAPSYPWQHLDGVGAYTDATSRPVKQPPYAGVSTILSAREAATQTDRIGARSVFARWPGSPLAQEVMGRPTCRS